MSSKKISPLSQIKYSKQMISNSINTIDNVKLNDVIKKEIIVIEQILKDSKNNLICQQNLVKYYPNQSKKTSTKKIKKICNRLDKKERYRLEKYVNNLKLVIKEDNEKKKIFKIIKYVYDYLPDMRVLKKQQDYNLLTLNQLIIEFAINLIHFGYINGFATHSVYLLTYFAYKTIYYPIIKPKNKKERLDGITNFINIIIGAQLSGLDNESINLVLSNLGIPTTEIAKTLTENELKEISGSFMFPIVKFRDYLKTDFKKNYTSVSLNVITSIATFVFGKTAQSISNVVSYFK